MYKQRGFGSSLFETYATGATPVAPSFITVNGETGLIGAGGQGATGVHSFLPRVIPARLLELHWRH